MIVPGETPSIMESPARGIASTLNSRFGGWLVSNALTEDQRREILEDLLANAAHEGMMTEHDTAVEMITNEESEALEMAAYIQGYLNAITDIDKGQGTT